MLRTIAIWKCLPFVTAPLVIASLGQWGLSFHSITIVRGAWDNGASECWGDITSPVIISLNYLYSEFIIYGLLSLHRTKKDYRISILDVAMLFDLIVLVFTTIGLIKSPGRSSLGRLLFRQGIVYFLVAFVANAIPTIFLLLNLNRARFHPSSCTLL